MGNSIVDVAIDMSKIELENVTKNFAPNVSPWCSLEAYLDSIIFSVGNADVPLMVKMQAKIATRIPP